MAPALTSASLAVCAAWGAIHVLAGRLRFLHRIPRSRWLSFSGGASIGYVFVQLLPELGEAQERLSEIAVIRWLEHHAYLAALAGLVAFYGLERLAARSREPSRSDTAGETTAGVFWLHTVSFALYNGLAGYLLLHRPRTGWVPFGLYAIAMGLHFVVNDYGLREHHKARYDRYGRWILAGALLAGWLIAIAVAVSERLVAVLFALLAGGVILNVLKEELPSERESRFWAFAAGCACYAALAIAFT